jgi:hypothetical protein
MLFTHGDADMNAWKETFNIHCNVHLVQKERKSFADFDASCLRGALPPVDFRAVCLVRPILY